MVSRAIDSRSMIVISPKSHSSHSVLNFEARFTARDELCCSWGFSVEEIHDADKFEDEEFDGDPPMEALSQPSSLGFLAPEDAEKILEPLTKEQLLPIIRATVLRHPDVLEAVRAVADTDPIQRKLFVRGLGWETTTEKLRQVFTVYGELDEANSIVITDKNSGKSKGYGFVTFKHIDAAILALEEPHKKIDGRITVTHLAAAGSSGHVGNIPFKISSERLLSHFTIYGEIEEGPLGVDKQTENAKGFVFFVYTTEEGAKQSLVEPMKTIDGHQVVCKLATDNKKQKPNVGPQGGGMVSQLANVNNLKDIPDKLNSQKETNKKDKVPAPIVDGFGVRLVNHSKKKKVHKDLRVDFQGVAGVVNIVPKEEEDDDRLLFVRSWTTVHGLSLLIKKIQESRFHMLREKLCLVMTSEAYVD